MKLKKYFWQYTPEQIQRAGRVTFGKKLNPHKFTQSEINYLASGINNYTYSEKYRKYILKGGRLKRK